MSFHIAADGTPDHVLDELRKSTASGDTSHHDAARNAAIDIVNSIPTALHSTAHIALTAYGHHDFTEKPVGDVHLEMIIRPTE